MKQIILGKAGNKNLVIDLDVLLRTRLLIQANSGGGKSWLLRYIAEQLSGTVPVIIIDPEGEFATLREKFPFVLVGKGGETPADVRSAELVAQKLLELRASAVIDLFEMKDDDRHEYVRRFLFSMINAPKIYWRKTVVIVDEAQMFGPEHGKGESVASDAMKAMGSRGRKRRFCFMCATQRLAFFSKDISAMLLNRLVGMTFEDVDLARVLDVLSVDPADKQAMKIQLKNLEPGQFFGFGRAISRDRILFNVGPVKTTHPDIDDNESAAPPPPSPEKIRSMLPKLADLPQQAEEMALTQKELRAENRRLKIELADAKRAQPKPPPPAPAPKPAKLKVIEVPLLDKKHIEGLIISTDDVIAGMNQLKKFLGDGIAKSDAARHEIAVRLQGAAVQRPASVPYKAPIVSQSTRKVPPAPQSVSVGQENGEFRLVGGFLKVLKCAAQYPEGVSDSQITLMTDYKKTSRGEFKKGLLRYGYVIRSGENIQATDKGIAALGDDFERLPVGDALREYWLKNLTGGELELFKIYLGAFPSEVTNQQIIDMGQYKKTSVGEFRKHLAARRLIEVSPASAKASNQLFDFIPS